MRFGVFLLAGRFPGQDDAAALQRAVHAVVAAEEAGFDDAWIAEHHFMPYGVCPSAITFAAYALGQTQRIEVGTAVSVLSTAHPVALAEQTALLDQLSGGRFRLGVGRGGPWVDLEVFGTGLDRWDHGFADGLDLLLDALTKPHVSGTTPQFSFREVPMVPRPVTEPHPSVAVACTSTPTAHMAAQRGLPMLLGMHVGDADKAAMVDQYDRARGDGADAEGPGHVSVMVGQVADSHREARALLLETMPPWLDAGIRAHVPVDDRPAPSRDPYAYAELLCDLHPVGTPADCAEHIASSIDTTGIDHVVLMVEGSGGTDRTLENIRRIGSEVLPRVQDR